MSKKGRYFESEGSIIWDILRRKYQMKTVNITVSLFLDMVLEIEQFMRSHGVQSRSMAVAFLIMQGMARLQEIQAEVTEIEKEKGIDGRPVPEGQARLTKQDKEDLRALGHVYDVEEP